MYSLCTSQILYYPFFIPLIVSFFVLSSFILRTFIITLEAIANRKSVRTYTNDIVESDKLEKILNVGNEAARAGEIYFTVVTNKEVLNMVAETGKNVMLNSGNDFLVNTA